MLYFDAQFFTYAVQQADLNGTKTKIPVTLTRAAISTAFGITTEKTEQFTISLNLAAGLQDLTRREHSADNDKAQKIESLYKKSLHQENRFYDLALKALLRREAGMLIFCADYQELQS